MQRYFTVLLLLISALRLSALPTCPSGTICGSATATVGQVLTYTLNDDVVFTSSALVIVDGTVQSFSRSGLNYTFSVLWNTAGTGSISVAVDPSVATFNVTITCPYTTPTTPNPTFSVGTNTCGNKTITYTGTPPTGYAWYWQTTSTGTSTANSTNSYSASASGTYYVNAKSTCGNYWSSGTNGNTITVTVNPVPPVPIATGDNDAPADGNGYAEVIVPDGLQAHWYVDSSTPTVLSNSPGFLATTAGAVLYYVSLYNPATTCESSRLPFHIYARNASTPPQVTQDLIRVANQTTDAQIALLTNSQKATTQSFLDGKGQPFQSVALNATPSGKNIVQTAEYDFAGRTTKSLLPYATSSSGLQRDNMVNDLHSFYLATGDKIADDWYPFAQTQYEQSPLGRPLVMGSFGQTWQIGNHTKSISYSYNTGAHDDELEEVRMLASNGTSLTAYYSANTLLRTTVTDEHGHMDIVFKDASGKTIVRKQQLDSTINGTKVHYLQTYYLYDSMNRLQYIIPPGGVAAIKNNSWSISSTIKDQHFHQFVYDNRGRLTQKKTPGQDWTYMVYDKFNRLVLTQDGNLRKINPNQWTFVKYDRMGRTVMSGIYTNTTQTTLAAVQGLVSGQYTSGVGYETRDTSSYYYTNRVFPKKNSDGTALQVYSINFFDDYDFDNNHSDDFKYDSTRLTGLPKTRGKHFRGSATGSYRLILGTSNWLKSIVFYDNYGRVIQTQGNSHLNLLYFNVSSVIYDFEGKVVQTKSTHSPDGTTITTTLQTPNYDVQGRISKIYHSINGAANQLVAQYEYNELGQQVTKKLHSNDGTNFLQNVDYRYNIRGWLTSINNAQLTNDANVTNGDTNDYFGMEMNYNTDAGNGNTLYYNGIVSSIKWKGAGATSGATDQRSYKFAYDKTDKLTAATFQKYGTAWNVEQNTLDETMSYDHNGNIVTLNRNQNQRGLNGTTVTSTAQTIDNLTYTYASGNRLSTVVDATNDSTGFKDITNATDYTYDTNGNLTQDLNKGINAITYNVLGKVQQISFSNYKVINYTYDAGGNKLSMSSTVSGVTTTTDYVNGYVYNTVSGTRTLSFFSSPEGRVVKNGSNYEYQYAIADHQGNTRIVFTSATPTAQMVTATFETNNQTTEATQFSNYGHISAGHASTTPGNSQYLNGSSNGGMVGVAKSYKVYPGDQLKIEAYGSYNTPGSSSTNLSQYFTGALLSAFGLSVPPGGETGTARSGINTWGGIEGGGYGDGTNDNTDPKAFVNIVLFDKNYKFLDVAYAQLKGNSLYYMTASYTVKEAGYAYLYVSNEQAVQTDVYFDDVKMTYTPTAVVQSNEYYPFGLQTANSWTRDNTTNNFLYDAGSELNSISGMYDLPYRNYDAALGRFFQVDPMATTSHSLNPYHYAGNNPISANDPTGLVKQYYANPEDDPYYQFVKRFSPEMYSSGGSSALVNLADYQFNEMQANIAFGAATLAWAADARRDRNTNTIVLDVDALPNNSSTTIYYKNGVVDKIIQTTLIKRAPAQVTLAMEGDDWLGMMPLTQGRTLWDFAVQQFDGYLGNVRNLSYKTPLGYLFDGKNFVDVKTGKAAAGVTVPVLGGTQSDIYISPFYKNMNAILFVTLGHELIHADNFAHGLTDPNLSEYAAISYSIDAGRANGLSNTVMQPWIDEQASLASYASSAGAYLNKNTVPYKMIGW